MIFRLHQKIIDRVVDDSCAEKREGTAEEELAALNIQDIDMSDLKFTFEGLEQEPFDESNLDDDSQKSNVIVTINFKSVSDYESAKEELQSIADNYDASLAVKMA